MDDEIVIVNLNKDGLWAPNLKRYLMNKGLKVHMIDKSEQRFSDGLYSPIYNEEELRLIDGKNVYLVGLPNPDDTPNNIETKFEFNTYNLKNKYRKERAKNVIAVMPYYIYARADKDVRDGDKYKGEINLIDINSGKFYTAGIDSVISLDVHNPDVTHRIFKEVYGRSSSFINIEMTELYYRYFLNRSYASRKRENGYDYFHQEGKDIVLISADERGYQKMMKFYKRMKRSFPNINFMAFEKIRYLPNNPNMIDVKLREKSSENLNLEGKLIMILEDIVDTCGTSDNMMRIMLSDNFTKEYGRFSHSIFMVTHEPLSMYYKKWNAHLKSIERLRNMPFDEIVFTDSLDYINYILSVEKGDKYTTVSEKRFEIKDYVEAYNELQKKLTILTLYPIIGRAILHINNEINKNGGKIPKVINIRKAYEKVGGKKEADIEMAHLVLNSSNFRTR